MSEAAETLLHYVSNWRDGCADDSDRPYCLSQARSWAAYLIADATAPGTDGAV